MLVRRRYSLEPSLEDPPRVDIVAWARDEVGARTCDSAFTEAVYSTLAPRFSANPYFRLLRDPLGKALNFPGALYDRYPFDREWARHWGFPLTRVIQWHTNTACQQGGATYQTRARYMNSAAHKHLETVSALLDAARIQRLPTLRAHVTPEAGGTNPLRTYRQLC